MFYLLISLEKLDHFLIVDHFSIAIKWSSLQRKSIITPKFPYMFYMLMNWEKARPFLNCVEHFSIVIKWSSLHKM